MRQVALPGPGRCEIVERDEPSSGPGDVVIDIGVSVLSPGTERAILLDLPTAGSRFPEFPGYMAAGTVRHGPAFPAGTRVAVRRARHARVAVVSPRYVRAVPEGVRPVDAAVWQLALTALHGLRTGEAAAGEPVTVVGQGLLGVITRRLATALGAPRVRAVAASTARTWSTRNEPATAFEEPGRFDGGTPLVIDATDSGPGLAVALAAAADGGRVVLLGSPRSEQADVPLQELHDRRLDLRGAHVSRMTEADEERLGDLFFSLLKQHRFTIRDVLADYPAHKAPEVYRRLAEDRAFISAVLHWDAPRPAPARPALAARPVRFGLLGCGDIGIEDARALAAASEVALSACHDPVREVAEETAGRFGGAWETSVPALLARPDVGVVLVATPHDTHETLLAQALAAGKHVLLEKPVAQDLAAAQRMAALAENSGLRTGVLFPTRTDPRFRRACEAVAAGEIGEPLGVATTYFTDKTAAYFLGGISGRVPTTWRLSKERAGGGFLIMNLIHQIDAVRALIGREPDRVYAETAPSATAEAPGIEDVVSVVLRFGTIVATLVGSASVAGGGGMRTRVWGEKGEVRLTPGFTLTRRGTPGHDDEPDPVPAPTAIDLRTWAFTRFARAIHEGTPEDVSLADGLRTQAVVEAAYASARLGRAISPARLLEGDTL
ncbi:Gfo/Idh/MocA family protein [Streptomyces luteolus]|uniref:Gfo/Idh/MocA family oxidoreductase n=1 Tax=Streptomyces luteolus TaxID=3043615 RepID=A0ABT6T921_9ACTN|nr:Gfo/Idh/MocA family oxidoreductase [Streptomyces sp. B-S-A12]MDI3423357.1 Gfo/Idh/MocA family oxidoreductase [Streptomyces sp. B-S-A12]